MMKRQGIFAIALLLSLAVAVGFAEANALKKEVVKTEISQKQDLTIEVIQVIELESYALCQDYAAIAPGIFTLDVVEIGNPVTDETPGPVKVRCSFRPVTRGPPKHSY